jgi:hypothetical protein
MGVGYVGNFQASERIHIRTKESTGETPVLADFDKATSALITETSRQESPEKAVQQHPELAPVYGYLRACEAKAEEDGINPQQRAIVTAHVCQNVADSIERGDVPEVKIKEEKQIESGRQRDPER